jgi:hypothetical protein
MLLFTYLIIYAALSFIAKRLDSTKTLRKSFNCAFAFVSSANVAVLTIVAFALFTHWHFYAKKVPN